MDKDQEAGWSPGRIERAREMRADWRVEEGDIRNEFEEALDEIERLRGAYDSGHLDGASSALQASVAYDEIPWPPPPCAKYTRGYRDGYGNGHHDATEGEPFNDDVRDAHEVLADIDAGVAYILCMNMGDGRLMDHAACGKESPVYCDSRRDEKVTCPKCREVLGYPSLEPESTIQAFRISSKDDRDRLDNTLALAGLRLTEAFKAVTIITEPDGVTVIHPGPYKMADVAEPCERDCWTCGHHYFSHGFDACGAKRDAGIVGWMSKHAPVKHHNTMPPKGGTHPPCPGWEAKP
ncbi:unnamed protein product [marine sediment metagenome]|uniref:Uncharacterized protein n=1 Tax=marine sediment metagenome TaxID=412755 RepID=X0TUN5_9ZZZZ